MHENEFTHCKVSVQQPAYLRLVEVTLNRATLMCLVNDQFAGKTGFAVAVIAADQVKVEQAAGPDYPGQIGNTGKRDIERHRIKNAMRQGNIEGGGRVRQFPSVSGGQASCRVAIAGLDQPAPANRNSLRRKVNADTIKRQVKQEAHMTPYPAAEIEHAA